jgi:hypothetical protein
MAAGELGAERRTSSDLIVLPCSRPPPDLAKAALRAGLAVRVREGGPVGTGWLWRWRTAMAGWVWHNRASATVCAGSEYRRFSLTIGAAGQKLLKAGREGYKIDDRFAGCGRTTPKNQRQRQHLEQTPIVGAHVIIVPCGATPYGSSRSGSGRSGEGQSGQDWSARGASGKVRRIAARL